MNMTSAVAVATCALLFTVASFWWLNAHRGRLKSYEPHSFAASLSGPVRIRLPLVLYNTGAVPIVVQGLRLNLDGQTQLAWVTTRSQLKPASNDNHQFAAVFHVPGRTAQQVFAEFGESGPVEAKDFEVCVEAKLGHRKTWVPVVSFTLRAGQAGGDRPYITYSNDPEVVSRRNQGTVS